MYNATHIKNKKEMKKNLLWAATAALIMTFTLPSCGDDDNVEPNTDHPLDNNDNNVEPNKDNPLDNTDNNWKPIQLTAEQRQLVNRSNDFAFNLFRRTTLGGPAGPCFATPQSTILSPISITYALGMLNNGAAGETQQQINQVLGFGETGADGINAFCQKMLSEAPQLDKLTKVMIANTIYMNKDYHLLPSFVQQANDYYGAQPETRDFADGKTCDVINQWASDHTEHMINQVLTENEFNPQAVSYLLNAIYFKGAWTEKFDKDNTRDEAFEGREQKVPMMHQEHEFSYSENELCQALQLPYGNRAFAMTILLPREGKTLAEVLQTLNAESWEQYRWMNDAIVDVKLPRFESQSNVNLVGIMSDLGMPRAFTDSAEFPNFCNVPTFISMMKQVARIKLDEVGTEAAAVTVIGMETTALPSEPQRVNFHANRPFLYVISERSTGTIFFIGQYLGD